MYKRFNQLSFVIGIFFVITSVILLGNVLLTGSGEKINIYSAVAFLIFGAFMIFLSTKEKVEQ
ncbi:hypothetical protein [Flavihumibacter fluvii]|jgi:hypothetical protein|uniref:hypothetical protein n=1 Tax=Flavihumibacter fluvii TaxID=2838157 RepID=UPI001BDF08F9|nr:hypothetical protein [Flavihumibacter fluvii]ULQ51294.1 hypothetical protein KJS93_14480 [Flavihumibacter fluvii]